MNLLTRLRATEGADFVRAFVDQGWPNTAWRAEDGVTLAMEPERDSVSSDDGMSRYRVALTIGAPGDTLSRTLLVREDGAVLSDEGETEFAGEFFDLASRACRQMGA